ncbi:MAG: hypothetical protein LUF80_00670 [Oscillospiraceae bacterium]|nr:hypothetical protein [Oscillospiraceae bacterium]
MKRNPKRTLLAWLLTAAMLASLLPAAALAAGTDAAANGSDDYCHVHTWEAVYETKCVCQECGE